MATKTKKKAGKARSTTAARAKKKAPRRAGARKAAQPRAPEMKHGTIVHLDFVAPDLEAASRTYSELFRWEFHPFQPTEMYFQAGPGGPCGSLAQGTPTPDNKTIFYVLVDDIQATLDRASALGASVRKPKTEIPGGHGFCAELRMPEGNIIGVYNRR